MKLPYNTKPAGSSQSAFSQVDFQGYLKSAIQKALELDAGEGGDYEVMTSSKGVTVIPYYPC